MMAAHGFCAETAEKLKQLHRAEQKPDVLPEDLKTVIKVCSFTGLTCYEWPPLADCISLLLLEVCRHLPALSRSFLALCVAWLGF